MQKRELSKEQQSSIISKAVNEADRINNLIENALLAARIESHSFQLQKDEFNLSDCVISSIQSRIIPGNESHLIKTQIEESVYMRGDALAISSLVLNLLENAEKYSPENSEIMISLHQEKQSAILMVADHGIGIPEKEKNRIFEKFYRIGSEDTRQTKGTGLGLFIVKHIVNFHNGDIKVSDNHPTGTIFKVTLPLA